MPVKLQGQHSFDAPRQTVWETILDPQALARTLPGCEKLEEVGENELAGALDIRVGPVQGKFQGNVTMSDVRPLEGYHLKIKGNGAAGFVDGEGDIRLEDAAGGGTVLHYEVDAQVGGRIAGVGQRLLDSSAKVVTRQALEGLERQVAARKSAAPAAGGGGGTAASAEGSAAAPGGSAAAEAAPAAPSQAEFAAGFVKGLIGELIPPERRPLVIGIALIVAVLVTWLVVRACGA